MTKIEWGSVVIIAGAVVFFLAYRTTADQVSAPLSSANKTTAQGNPPPQPATISKPPEQREATLNDSGKLRLYLTEWRDALNFAYQAPRSSLPETIRELQRINRKIEFDNVSGCYVEFKVKFLKSSNASVQSMMDYVGSGTTQDYTHMLNVMKDAAVTTSNGIKACGEGK